MAVLQFGSDKHAAQAPLRVLDGHSGCHVDDMKVSSLVNPMVSAGSSRSQMI